MPRKKTHEQFVEELSKINPDIVALEEYESALTKILFECKRCNNKWHTTPSMLLCGHGCPKCGYEKQKKAQRKTHEQFVLELAKINPHIEAIDRYINNSTAIKFSCKICNNVWKTVPNSVLFGHGCPACSKTSTSFFEQVIFHAFKLCLGEKAVKLRDRKLIGMELDIYIPTLSVAFEPGSWAWHKNKLQRDEEKRARCRDKSVRLITIYTEYPNDEKPFYDNCWVTSNSLGYSNWNETRYFVEEVLKEYNLFLSEDQWTQIRRLALEKSKRRTQQEFVDEVLKINPNIEVVGQHKDNKTKILFRCKICNNTWRTVPSVILQGSGCPKCGQKRTVDALKKSHEEFIEALYKINNNIKVLGTYSGSKVKIACKCIICENEWETTPNGLLRGFGCPKCGRKKAANSNKKSPSKFSLDLKSKNKKVELIGTYVDSKTKVLVRCQNCGHEWKANPTALLMGQGCNFCYGSHKKTQEQFAKELSVISPNLEVLGEYTSAHQKLSVKCKDCSFEWLSTPHYLLRGHGCPKCNKNAQKKQH